MIDIRAIRAANPLPSIVAATVKLQRVGNEWKGCCPFHPDRSPSFTVFAGGERFHCFGCGAHGDVLDYVARLHRTDLAGAARLVDAGNIPTVKLPAVPAAARANRTEEARRIWQAAGPVAGTLAEAYLLARGLEGPPPEDIRFSRLPYGNSAPMPCLVAAVRDVAGAVIGLQRIYLRRDGRGKADLPKPKLSLGKVAGGAIRLGDLGEGDAVTVCEGPEDGMTLLEALGSPVWVAAGASMLPAMIFPAAVRSVVIGADNDGAGKAAAQKAGRAFVARGLVVRIIHPLPSFKDFNAELMGVHS